MNPVRPHIQQEKNADSYNWFYTHVLISEVVNSIKRRSNGMKRINHKSSAILTGISIIIFSLRVFHKSEIVSNNFVKGVTNEGRRNKREI